MYNQPYWLLYSPLPHHFELFVYTLIKVIYALYSDGSRTSHKGEGGGHPDPEIRGEPSLQKVFFRSAFRASIWLDCEQSLFFFRFSESNARAWERRSRETRETRAAASPVMSAPSFTRVVICVSHVLLDGLQKKERLLVVYNLV